MMSKELKAVHRVERKLMKTLLSGNDKVDDLLAELNENLNVALDEPKIVELEILSDIELSVDKLMLDCEPVEVVIERLERE